MRVIAATIVLLLICPAVSLAQNEPFVAIRATEVARQSQQVYPNCPDGRCPLVPPLGWGRASRQAKQTPPTLQFNGVVIDVVPVAPGNGVTVLTCAHAFRSGGNPQVQIAGSWRDAQVVATEFARDLALLWVPATTSPKLAIAQTDPDVGAEVFLHVYDHQRGGGFVRVPGQLGKPLRATNGIARWESSGGAVKGMSGGAYTHNGELIGIQIQADQPLDREESVFAIAILAQRDSILKFLTSYGVSHQIRSGDGQGQLFAPSDQPSEPKNNQNLPADGGSPEPPLERQANPDAPDRSDPVSGPIGGASGTLQPPSQDATAPQDAGTEAPLSFPDLAKSWAWDRLSGWGWAAVGAGLFGSGSLAAWAVPVIGRRIVRSVTQSGGDPVSPPAGGGGVDLRGGHAVPPPRNTDVGRERIVERVIDLSADERRKYEQQIADLRSQSPTVEYREIVSDVGLGRMRQAMDLTAKKYPSSARWVQLIEQVYNKILSGEKLNA